MDLEKTVLTDRGGIIVAAFEEMYGAEVSATLVSKVTDAVIEQVLKWQNRPLDELYPIVYMDCIRVKVRQDKRVINKAVYIALGINLNGAKECWVYGFRKMKEPSFGYLY